MRYSFVRDFIYICRQPIGFRKEEASLMTLIRDSGLN